MKISNQNNKNIIIGVLAVIICAIAVGYAALSATLTINGTTNITGTWSQEISAITSTIPTGSEASVPTNGITIDGTTATFAANLKKPGDSITFNITLKNTGNISARLTSVVATPNVAAANDLRTYSLDLTGVTANPTTGTVLAQNGTLTFKYTITYKADAAALPGGSYPATSTVTLVANFAQA